MKAIPEFDEVGVLVEDGAADIAPVEDVVAIAALRRAGAARHEGDYDGPRARMQRKSTLSPGPHDQQMTGPGHAGQRPDSLPYTYRCAEIPHLLRHYLVTPS